MRIILHLCEVKRAHFRFYTHAPDRHRERVRNTHLHTHSKWTTIIMHFSDIFIHSRVVLELRTSFLCKLPIGWWCCICFLRAADGISITKFHVEHNKSWQWEIQTNHTIRNQTKPNKRYHLYKTTHIPYTCYDVNWKRIKNWSHNGMRQMFSRLIKIENATSQPTNVPINQYEH